MHAQTDASPDAPVTLTNRDYYCLQYNHAGVIDVQIDDQATQTVRGPSLLVTSPGHSFVFGNSEGWHHNYIAFRGTRIERYIESGLLPVARPLMKVRDSSRFLRLFESCVQSWRDGRLDEACHQLEGLLLMLHAPAPESGSFPRHRDIRDLAASMREAPTDVYELAKEAQWMHISEAHLRRLFRRLIGTSPQRFLLQCRLTGCADRLATTRDPIKQVSAEYHFESVHHFSRVFSKQYGVPPGRFRRETSGD